MRVIAGTLRGRRLAQPDGDATRPTSDRVREAMFSTISGLIDLPGARVLDLYAGTGALGVEAASRGAAHVTFVERARPALTALRANAALAAQAGAMTNVQVADADSFAGDPGAQFDLVLADPPYAHPTAAITELLSRLSAGALHDDSLVVVERDARDDAPVIAGWEVIRQRRYGGTVIHYLMPVRNTGGDAEGAR